MNRDDLFVTANIKSLNKMLDKALKNKQKTFSFNTQMLGSLSEGKAIMRYWRDHAKVQVSFEINIFEYVVTIREEL